MFVAGDPKDLLVGAVKNSDHQSEARSQKRKLGLFSFAKWHARKIGVLLFSVVCSNVLFYRLVGVLNRMFGRPIRSIFLFYATNRAYQDTMIYPWYSSVVRWRPGLGQIINQGCVCLSFGITSNEKDFRNPENEDKLRKLFDDVERIRKIIGADQKTFSGELPSIFVSRGIMTQEQSVENRNTTKAVVRAIADVIEKEKMPSACPVVILGARGFTGRQVTSALLLKGHEVFPVDLGDDFPMVLFGKPLLIVNITKRGALREYIPRLWKEAVVLNEVYPEPSDDELALLQDKKITCYHISGVAGKALPSFKRAYEGAIPCCASFLENDRFEMVIKRLA